MYVRVCTNCLSNYLVFAAMAGYIRGVYGCVTVMRLSGWYDSRKWLLLVTLRRSPEWTVLTEADKKSLGLNFEDDGEFWRV